MSCSSWAQQSCCTAFSHSWVCGIVLEQGSSPGPLHWQAESLPRATAGVPAEAPLFRRAPSTAVFALLSPGRVPLTLGFLSVSPLPSAAITALKETVGWRYSMLFVGLLQLNLVVCGALLRPIVIVGAPGTPKTPAPEHRKEAQYMLENEKTRTSIDSIDSGVELTTSPKNVPGHPAVVEPEAELQARGQPGAPLLDFSVLTERSFICYTLFGLFVTLGFFAPSLYIIPLGLSLGLDRDRAALLLCAMAVAEVFGRIGAGLVLNREPIRKVYIELICVILLTLSLFTFTFAAGFWGLMACSVFSGAMIGTVAGTHIPLLAEDDVVGIQKMSSAAGVYVFFQSISGLAGPPLAGKLLQKGVPLWAKLPLSFPWWFNPGALTAAPVPCSRTSCQCASAPADSRAAPPPAPPPPYHGSV